jgi:hypothetical protein
MRASKKFTIQKSERSMRTARDEERGKEKWGGKK